MLGARQSDVYAPRGFDVRSPRMLVALAIKRCLDISVGLTLCVVAAPLMAAIAVAICLDSPGPALFRPKRIGRHGKPFAMLKFRTMVRDAEERLQEVAHLNVANGMVKIPDDPRVTRVGKWLRRYSLDELPQIINILAGHMSLVGPRPHDVHELAHEDLTQDRRLSVRPGLTGLWQVSARSDPNLASRVHYDLHYVNRWSLVLDATILARTIPVVVRGNGGAVDRHEATAAIHRQYEVVAGANGGLNGASNGHANGAGEGLNGATNGHINVAVEAEVSAGSTTLVLATGEQTA